MVATVARKGVLRSLVYPLLRPVYYPARHYYRVFGLRTAGLSISEARSIEMGLSHQELAQRMKKERQVECTGGRSLLMQAR